MTPIRGSVRLDTARLGIEAFREGWAAQIGDGLPAFGQEATAGARVRGRASRVRDAVVTDFEATTRVRVDATVSDRGELRLYVVHRGTYVLRLERRTITVTAGQFLLHRSTESTGYEIAAGTTARVIGLSADAISPSSADPEVTGPVAAPEVRLLLGHTDLVHETVGDLSDGGVHASRHALAELVRGVLRGYVDDAEPRLVEPLVRAAHDLADRLLTDPELTPALLAERLHVSLRTLHRAFASAGEPVAAYIRRRRLEEARGALVSATRSSVSEIAAHWQFSDASHFIRTFRRRYGRTPAEYARDARAAAIPSSTTR